MSTQLPRDAGIPRTSAALALVVGVALLAAALVTANAFAFAWHASIPLPVSDAWYFLEAFGAKAVSGDLNLRDFFAQRSAGDHAQPFQRLVLLAHLRFADLDFRVEALVGLAGAAVAALGASWIVWRNAAPSRRMHGVLAAAAVWMVVFSMNATEIYTWSLVALGWWMVASAIVFWALAAVTLGPSASFAFGLLAALALGLVWDEVAIPLVIAALVARLLVDRTRNMRATLLILAGAIVGIMLARALLADFAGGDAAEATGGSLVRLLPVIASPDAWHAVTGPLLDSLVHRSHLDAWAGPAADAWQVGIATLLAVAHVLFWWRILTATRLPGRTVTITAVAMMLFFYASVAGILLSRSVDFGPTYVHQPRYVLVFQLNIIALILLFVPTPAVPGHLASSKPERFPWIAAVAILGLAALQYPLARAAWAHAPYLRPYVERSALTMGALASAPAAVPAGGCSQILSICAATPQVRKQVMQMLVEHRLSVFSPQFQARHGLYPDAKAAAVAAGVPACSRSVVDWGPRKIVRGQAFNAQADGRSAFWVKLAPRARVGRLTESGENVVFVSGDGVLTFPLDEGLAAKVAASDRLAFSVECPHGGSAPFEVPILPAVPGI